jgi:hypothetical protein
VEYITAIWCILGPFGNSVVNWYIFPHFGILYQEKSGNPDGRVNGEHVSRPPKDVLLDRQFP